MSSETDQASNEIEKQKKLLEENLSALNEGDPINKDTKNIPEKDQDPDFDDYYEVKDEEPELKIQKGQTIEQAENESEDYF